MRQIPNVGYNSIYHHTKFESNQFINVRMHANVKLFEAVSKTAVISLLSLNLTQNLYWDVQFDLLQHHIKLHPDLLKNV